MGKLSTHILDTSRGRPAAGVKIELRVAEGEGYRLLGTVTTNSDGRTDRPLLQGDELQPGAYELLFYIGDHFAAGGGEAAKPFLDQIPVRFNLSDPAQNYHIPLLVTPWSYSTYRGS